MSPIGDCEIIQGNKASHTNKKRVVGGPNPRWLHKELKKEMWLLGTFFFLGVYSFNYNEVKFENRSKSFFKK